MRTLRHVMPFAELLASKPLEVNARGCWCMTCLKPTDSEEIVEEFRGPLRNGIRIRVRCHGSEEVGAFEFGSQEWDHTDIERAQQRRRWFDPHGVSAGNVIANGKVTDE